MNLEKNQTNLFPLGYNKDVISKTLKSNEDIVSLIVNDINYSGDLDDILSSRIITRLKVPETQIETKTYICIETFVPSIESDEIKEIGIVINVFCNESIIDLSSKEIIKFTKKGYFGNRIDCTIDAIDRCLNGKRGLGIGRIRFKKSRPINIIQPINGYYGKSMEYTLHDFNTTLKI